ncbi:hypothetical protein D3C85_1727870 [compost metagenome]
MPASKTNILKDWSVRRSGGFLVITGRDADGQDQKFNGVSVIYGPRSNLAGPPSSAKFWAKNGVEWVLA